MENGISFCLKSYKSNMAAEIIDTQLLYTVEHYHIEVEVNGKLLKMHVTVEGESIDHIAESDDIDKWNNLEQEEKYAIDEVIREYF